MKKSKPVWEKTNPVPMKRRKKMTPEQKSQAKARAKKAGRPYPNAVDNIAVSKKS